ncbi:Cyclin, N-terminal domain [Carpediemonas membranifera]|uniref:Cyclin, N-terminal domain n=1 Tax=Carpediemonas membranifera TaxID=201153 RepID=A0A8J6AP87_9EUKA|nr:Cyclin, N-terminal domain [Carpediemonas membranifera]|eukprot:KAG9389626.1 Cyclin, N-terminal domain [Carpediemonas membranifera]
MEPLTDRQMPISDCSYITRESLSEIVGPRARESWRITLELHLRKEETSTHYRDYLEDVQHGYITKEMRKEAIRFIVDVCAYDAHPSVVCERSIRLFDQCLAYSQVRRQAVQLLTLGAISVSTKLEDDGGVSLNDLVRYSDGLYTPPELMAAEQHVLDVVNWDAYVPSSHRALSSMLGLLASDGEKEEHIETLWALSSRFIILSVEDYGISQMPPSTVATGVLTAALLFVRTATSSRSLDTLAGIGVDVIAAEDVAKYLLVRRKFTSQAAPTLTTPHDAKRALGSN